MGKWAHSTAKVALVTLGLSSLATGVSAADTSTTASTTSTSTVKVARTASVDSTGFKKLKLKDTWLATPTPPAQTTSGNGSVLGGNQIHLPISAPVNICGNAAAVLGVAKAACAGGASVHNHGTGHGVTSGNFSVLGGNQIDAPISAPVNICGNAIAGLGLAKAACLGGAHVRNENVGGPGEKTSGNFSVGGGNQITAPISVPVNICGNAIAGLGVAKAACVGGAHVRNHNVGGSGNTTSGNFSLGGGNQITAPISVPINICGNAIAVGGESMAACAGGATVHNSGGHGPGNTTSGNGSLLGGNQIYLPISAPINICGNAINVLGVTKALCEEFGHTPHCLDGFCPPPPCHGEHCPPPCHMGHHCPPPCHVGHHCPPPPCHGDHCPPPPCHGDHCPPPPCHGDECMPVMPRHHRPHEANAGALPFTGGPIALFTELAVVLLLAGSALLGTRRVARFRRSRR